MSEAQELKHSGVKIVAAGKEYIVPALNFKQVKALKTMISQLKESTLENGLDHMLEFGVPLIAAAMKRNYPDMTEEQLDEIVDAGNFSLFIGAALGNVVGESIAAQVGSPSVSQS